MADYPPPFDQVPVNRHLGFKLVAQGVGTAEVSMELREDFIQETGVVHGGILTTLADTACVYALMPELGPEQTMTSIELKLNFLRPVLTERGVVTALATKIQLGRTVGVSDVEISQSGKPVARGLFTYLVRSESGQ
jgi:uncharacterized protein (TIGR00369 family)